MMSWNVRAMTVALLILLSAVSARAALENEVRQHRLANGMTLLVVERHEVPTVDAYIAVGVGSVYETSRNRGVAHLLEHMLFKGTRTVGTRDYAKEKPLLDRIAEVGGTLDRLKNDPAADPERLQALRTELKALQEQHRPLVVKDEFSRLYAAAGGVGFNAFTSRDMTTYLVSLPSNKLELWAALEADRMRAPVLREFYTEREVVREERRRSYESDPNGLMFENLLSTAYIVHPYRNPIIGWDTDIDNLTLTETEAFLHAYYAPVNTVIALVGDVDFTAAVALVERYFGNLAPGEPVPPVVDREPEQVGERRLHISYDAEPRLMMAFHKPTLPDQDDYVFDLLDMVLGDGPSSRLYRSLVIERQIATSVSTSMTPGSRFPNLFVISATPRQPHSLAALEAAITEELEKIGREPVDTASLERARVKLATDQLRSLRDNGTLARMLTFYQTVAGDWHYLTSYAERVAAITPGEVQTTAARYLVPRNCTVVTLSREEGL